jgi:non-specific serine/threonine protein kinase
VDWSYNLLSDQEKAVLRRASVFAGGFALEAAEAVCAAGTDVGTVGGRPPPVVAEHDVLDLVGQLVDKSLVQSETRGEIARYRLLETIRLYGRERLLDAAEAVAARDRHLAWCLRLAEGVPGSAGTIPVADHLPSAVDDTSAEARLVGEHDNLRAALEWALGRDPQAGLRLALHLGHVWVLSHLLPDPGAWLDGLLVRVPEPGELRTGGLVLAAIVHRMCGAPQTARAHLQAARTHYEQTDNRVGLARLDEQEGLIAAGEGDRPRARALLETSLAVLRELGHPQAATVLRNLGLVAIGQGDLDRARAALEESVALVRAQGGRPDMATARLGVVARLVGDLVRARAIFEECLARRPDAVNVALVARGGLGDLAREAGDYGQARAHYDRLARGEVPATFSGIYLSRMGILAVRQGSPARGARLLGAVSPAALAFLRTHLPDVQADHEAAVAGARTALGGSAFTAAWAEGQAMTLDEAVAYALEAPDAA